jgi:hypothetical protein
MRTGNKDYLRAIYTLDTSYNNTTKAKQYILAEKNNDLIDEILK